MTALREKKDWSGRKSWPCLVNSVEFSQKKVLCPANGNLYAYAANNPVHYIDPNGLTTIVNEADGHVLDVQRDGDTSILAYPYTSYGQSCEGPAPYYGENKYQYRCSLTGYNQTMTGIFSPVNSFSFSIKGK